jgi:hypothetical protein
MTNQIGNILLMFNFGEEKMGRSLLQKIESFLKSADMPPSVFGRHAAKDPRLVSDIRAGRDVGHRLNLRIEHFMNMYSQKLQNGEAFPLGDQRTRERRGMAQGMEMHP